MWYPAIALGDSMRTSVSRHASHAVFNRSSIQPRNYGVEMISIAVERTRSFWITFCIPSRKNDTVKVPFSTHIRMSSVGSPPTYPNSMPYYKPVNGHDDAHDEASLTDSTQL